MLKPAKSGSVNARVISRARSGRKLKKMMESPLRSWRRACRSPARPWHDEFVHLFLVVALLHRLHGGIRDDSLALHHRIVRFLYALKAVVAVHRVVTAHHRSDLPRPDFFHFGLELFDVALAAVGRHVAAVHKAVHVYLGKPALLRHAQQRIEVLDVAVHAAVRDEAVGVQLCASLHRVVHCADKLFFLKEAAGPRCPGDARQLLIYDAPGADIQVPHLGVAHLPFRQAHGPARGLDRGRRKLRAQLRDVGHARDADRVAPAPRLSRRTRRVSSMRSVFYPLPLPHLL